MQFSPNDILSPDILIYDIVSDTDDKDFRKNTRGWYISQIQQALDDIEYEAGFTTKDYDAVVPEDLKMVLPSGCFELLDVFVYNGELRQPSSPPEPVWWKRNMRRHPGNDYSANIRGGIKNEFGDTVASKNEDKLFCNAVNGILTLSRQCGTYDYIQIVYKGTSTDIGQVPFIPRILRQYTIAYVEEKFWRVMKGREPNDRSHRANWSDAMTLLDGPGMERDKALRRTKKLDKKFLNDMHKYLAKMNY